MARPRKEWFAGNKRREKVKKESKSDLKDIKKNFEE
jgi:hypothetical protein